MINNRRKKGNFSL